jgi:hypothetical protein
MSRSIGGRLDGGNRAVLQQSAAQNRAPRSASAGADRDVRRRKPKGCNGLRRIRELRPRLAWGLHYY